MKFAPVPKGSSATYATDARRWRALVARDRRADGYFVYSVETTGIYCRPACPSRLPARENVQFHTSAADAERSGFRACKRCHPNAISTADRQSELILAACRTIEEAETPPLLKDLARAAGLSTFYFQRLFKSTVGVSPRQYAAQHRSRLVRSELRKGRSVTEAIYRAGYGSSSRFYETASKRLGMSPAEFSRAGDRNQISFTITQSSLGPVLVAATARGICSVKFGDSREELEAEFKREFTNAISRPAGPEFRKWVKAVVNQIEEPARAASLPLDIRGTAFQHRVWEALGEIPAGQTVTYTEVAARIGAPAAIRAVASAIAMNPVAVVVPCHRVVRKDKTLAGYRWGLHRKRTLLVKERKQE